MDSVDKLGEGLNPKPGSAETPQHQPGTVTKLSEALNLSEDLFHFFQVTDITHNGAPAAAVPYFDESGNTVAVRLWSGTSQELATWQDASRPTLYGQQFLPEIRRVGWVLIVQSETDVWTASYYQIPALGVPERSSWSSEWTTLLQGLRVFVWEPAETAELTPRLVESGLRVKIISVSENILTLTDWHLQGLDIASVIETATESLPVPLRAITHDPELRRLAEPILYADDPLLVVEHAVRAMGYGGAIWPIQVVYLAATSRLLRMRPGSMPVHLLLVGSPSAGKSFVIDRVLSLLPPDAYKRIDSGSPTVLIYGKGDLRHRVLIFGEMDSLPSGEESPVASAIRSLLQDHVLRYDVTIRSNRTGDLTVRHIERPGPTALITSGIRRLPEQLDSRVFSLEMPDDTDQIAAALEAQANLEVTPAAGPDPALVAFQTYLQTQAPWDVLVPFAPHLSRELRKNVPATRILRDFSRLISLIKARALLSHTSRRTNHQGSVIADVDDYAAIYDLVDHMYAVTASGASERLRSVVRVVNERYSVTQRPVSVTDVASLLRMAVSTASRYVKVALKHGWLVNPEGTRQHFKLQPGDTIPPASGLPQPEAIRQAFGE